MEKEGELSFVSGYSSQVCHGALIAARALPYATKEGALEAIIRYNHL